MENSVTTNNENPPQAALEEMARPALMDEETSRAMALEMRSLAGALFRLLQPQRPRESAQPALDASEAPPAQVAPVAAETGLPLPEPPPAPPPTPVPVPALTFDATPQAPVPVPVPANLSADDAVPVSHESGAGAPVSDSAAVESIAVPPIAVPPVSHPSVEQDADDSAVTDGDVAAPPSASSAKDEPPAASTKRRSMAVLNEIAFLDD